MAERAQIAVKGVVQGVGFRPYIYALATSLGLTGFVTNTADGVIIEAEGEKLSAFLDRLRSEAPPLSRITQIIVAKLPFQGYRDFTIRPSRDSSRDFTLVSPDASTCPDCLRELLDPGDRRYRYPFINCTNCGPRYSITRQVPYDRPNTTMAPFAMCADCEREYHDPRDRRFHAQPNACPECGPRVTFRISSSAFGVLESDPVLAAIEVLRQGGIVAVKGLGGFHIACDATADTTVRLLRERKRKSNKPFAIMCPDMATIRQFVHAGREEEALLTSVERPVVLLRKRRGDSLSAHLSEVVSPQNQYVGCMLPYTPLHHLLFHGEGPDSARCSALVMTSGNLSEEPIVRDNEEAVAKLSGIVDAFLFHDRDIFMRVDDSVMRVTDDTGEDSNRAGGKETPSSASGVARRSSRMFIRRSRGFAPDPVQLDSEGPEVLGCGADLKNTFTLTKGAFAISSQHIGDMENYETLRFYEECLANLKQVYRAEPTAVVHDLHPGYLSTRWAQENGSRDGLACYALQHHYAHIGSVMAEHGLREAVLGIAFDGTGYGTDGNLWGGEFLVAGIEGFERLGQFAYLPLPGGEAAIREPWRTAVSAVRRAEPELVYERLHDIGFPDRYGRQDVDQVLRISASRDLSPSSSGVGRLFDAVSALIGVCDRNTFEGEAAMALESLVRDGIENDYPVVLGGADGYIEVDVSPMVRAIIGELVRGGDRSVIATKFHNTIANTVVSVATAIRRSRGITKVALSGGTFQNLFLLQRTSALLSAQGMDVYRNVQMPPNDACISLGQAYLVRERLKKGMVA